MISEVRFVGRYELLDPIGQGGMAVVYLARQTDLDREVALKELRIFQAPEDPALAERFLREARVAGAMSHPNIVTVHEYFKHEDTPYIAMEYLRRGSLRPWVGRISLAQVVGVLEGLLAALDHAEGNHIVHRDLKPENVLITDQGQVKVADFGIAKARTVASNVPLTVAGTTLGTPSYMAPEQAMAQDLGPYTDLYSIGVMAYELLVGRVPFDDSDTPVAMVLRHVNEQIPPACSVNAAVDPALSDWIDRLLIKDPHVRTQTAGQAWDALEEIALRLLGSRWRREARLSETGEQLAERPLTPAPFASTDPRTPQPQQASPPAAEEEYSRASTPATAPTPPPPPTPPAPAVSQPRSTAPPDRSDEQFDEPGREARSSPAGLSGRADVDAPTVMPDYVPEHSRAAESAPRRRRPSRRLVLFGAAAVALVAVGVVLVLGGGSKGSEEPVSAGPAPGLTLSNEDLTLIVPATWLERAAPKIPGLPPRAALAAASTTDGYVTAQLVSGSADPTLLPTKLRAALKGKPPQPDTVELGQFEAYRYAALRPRGIDEQLRVYAVLTTAGVATVACASPTALAKASARECDEIATTLKLSSARGLPLGPSEDYGAILKRTFATLDRRIRSISIKYSKARTVTSQARTLRSFARAYELAIRSIKGGRLNAVDQGLNKKVQALFTTLAAAYGGLERALRNNDAKAYARAQRALKRTRAKIKTTTDALQSAGYKVTPPKVPATKSAPRAGSSAPTPPAAPPPVSRPPPVAQPPVDEPPVDDPPADDPPADDPPTPTEPPTLDPPPAPAGSG